MIVFENAEVVGWEHAIRGMRNPLNSWSKSDSEWESGNWCDAQFIVGHDDIDLMNRLSISGQPHRKFARMIVVYVDILAPLYWWKEFDTYKVGTVANSCSTMHKIHSKELTLDDFSHEHLSQGSLNMLEETIDHLNHCRHQFNETKDKSWWWNMIQLLPSSFNQKRTVMLNYEVLMNIYKYRRNHKLKEWQQFCGFIEMLPHWYEITEGVDWNDKH